jgi:hypothetical protein
MWRLPVVLVLCCGLCPVAAQEQTASQALDASARATAKTDNALAGVLWHLAVASRIPIGFESAAATAIPRSLEDTPSLDGIPLAEALDAAIAADGRYEWRNMTGIVVVRQARAWTDAADPLNRPVRNLAIASDSLWGVLVGLRDFVYTSRFVNSNRGTTVSLRVNAGTTPSINWPYSPSRACGWHRIDRPGKRATMAGD